MIMKCFHMAKKPQGLVKTKNKDLLISTEHARGDEINLINVNNVENYGWPISSYGFLWRQSKRTFTDS